MRHGNAHGAGYRRLRNTTDIHPGSAGPRRARFQGAFQLSHRRRVMAEITLQGNPIHTKGELPAKGSTAQAFHLTTREMKDLDLNDFQGRKVLNIFPSLDTPTCATSVRQFNRRAAQEAGLNLLMISADLPFAHNRFCEAEGIENVTTLSTMRDSGFAENYGVLMTDGPLAGITARAVVVLDENNQVLYTELVPEIADEPDYEAALRAAKK